MVDSQFIFRYKFDKSQRALVGVYESLDGLYLDGSLTHMVMNATVNYAHWWHSIVGATCIAIHILGSSLPTCEAKKQKRGTSPRFKHLKVRHSSGSLLHP